MKKRLDKSLGAFLISLLFIMVLAVLWQVFSRYILNAPSSITEELSRYLLIWIGILGAAYAAGQQAHLSINLLEEKLNPRNRQRLRVIINLLIIFFCITALILGGGNLVYKSYDLGQHSAALNLPMYIVYMALPISGFLIIAYKINEILNPEKYLL